MPLFGACSALEPIYRCQEPNNTGVARRGDDSNAGRLPLQLCRKDTAVGLVAPCTQECPSGVDNGEGTISCGNCGGYFFRRAVLLATKCPKVLCQNLPAPGKEKPPNRLNDLII